jgi:hypothetical protein
VKRALEWGRPPTGLLRRSSEWIDQDYILAEAWSAYQQSLCPCGCGFPRDQAWDDTMDGWFEAHETACYAKAAKERWEKDHSERNKSGDLISPPREGSLVYVVDSSEAE